MAIPKIIHQVWSGKYEPLPDAFAELAQTWKDCHPEWTYMFWDNQRIDEFIHGNYPQYIERYNSFPYDIQRWDAIRYLILYKMGGMYVDFDYECFDNIEPLLKGECCFAMEPKEHTFDKYKDCYFNNALMFAIPQNEFMYKIIERVFTVSRNTVQEDKFSHVLNTTGPLMLADLYQKEECRTNICLIPAIYVSPFSKDQASQIINGNLTSELEEKLQDAYAVHYFIGKWIK